MYVIFDMDETLAATSPIWVAAELALLNALGVPRTDDLAIQYKGMNALDVAATIHRIIQPPNHSLEQCQHLMRSTLLDQFRHHPAHEMPGAIHCVKLLARHTKLALASGSPLEGIEIATRHLGIYHHFNVVISSELGGGVKRGKPHPDVFLAAAEKLGVNPRECLVIEDSLLGVEAALAANMKVFAVPSSNHESIKRIATRVFNSLSEITWQYVKMVQQ